MSNLNLSKVKLMLGWVVTIVEASWGRAMPSSFPAE